MLLSSALGCTKRMLYATNNKQRRAKKSQRMTVRRMMSYYNDNPSIFTLDLASAIHRQSNFIEKMQHIDWLHSPALSSTTSRVIHKYRNFIQVMTQYPNEMAVPTLDVDLAWHTHQLTPSSYYKYTVSRTGKFIDHDDKVSSHKLSESFARTSRNYQRLFDEPYSECTCWYCEAMHASVSKYPGRFMLPNRAKGYRRPTHAPDDHTAAHISTHNVVKLQDAPPQYRTKALQHLSWLEKAYQRACERAKQEGRAPPVRRHPAVNKDTEKSAVYIDPMGMGMYSGTGMSGKAAGATIAAVGGGVLLVGATAIALTADGDLYFGHDPEEVHTNSGGGGGGGGGCVAGSCGGGVGWGGGSDDTGGTTGACGGTGGSCSGGDGGGGCGGGCGGCGG